MTVQDLVTLRLRNHNLLNNPQTSPESLIRHMAAVQAQDYPAAKWAVAQRSVGATNASLDELFNEGKILRTHIVRPTWHFVLPEDIVWLEQLTGGRVNARSKSIYNSVNLDEKTFKKSNEIICQALEGHTYLTRPELGKILESKKISTEGLRLGFIVGFAELEGLICSGPLKGKQHTYALIAERAPNAKKLERDEALMELARRYFASHGPATLQDFSWWSWVTLTDAKKAVELLGAELEQSSFEGATFWHLPSKSVSLPAEPLIHLIPNFDEFTVAYKEREMLTAHDLNPLDSRGAPLLTNIILLGGMAIGGWRRTLKPKEILVELKLMVKLPAKAQAALEAAVHAYGHFHGLPVKIDQQLM